MTHAELVERAGKWLKGTARCGVVFTELTTYANEIPDAIGWTHHRSFLIECKASRSDFLADKTKRPRQRPEICMGNFRFYMTPPGLVDPDEILEGWGLLEVHGKRVTVVKRAAGWKADFRSNEFMLPMGSKGIESERMMMYSALRRMDIRGFLKHVKDPLLGAEPKGETS